MNRGLLAKTVREVRLATALFALGTLSFEALVGIVWVDLQDEFVTQVLEIDFVRNLISAFLGSDMEGQVGPWVLKSMVWLHPVLLTLVFAQVITYSTRMPAGEIDSGTIDVALGMPVSRWQVYVNEGVVALACGALMVGGCVLGHFIGMIGAAEEARTASSAVLLVAGNLYCLYLTVAGFAFAVSASSERRGRAVAGAFTFVLVSMLIFYLAQFWGPADRLSWLSFMDYYQPAITIRDALPPYRDMVVLLVAGVGFWGIGGIIFARRDICTV